jgi:hypothetical protein
MNFASVKQSENLITNNLYSAIIESMDPLDMEKYNENVINKQIEDGNKNRLAMEQDAKNRVLEFNQLTTNLKNRYAKFLEKTQNTNGWDDFKNHWYWKSYFENANKTGYSEMDNYIDNLKPEKYKTIELKKGYQQLGDFKENVDEPAPYVDEEHTYLSNTGEYVYNQSENKIYPKEKNSVYDENSIEGIKQTLSKTDDLGQLNGVNDLVFRLKDLQQSATNNSGVNMSSEGAPLNYNSRIITPKESFESVDPKLAQIYQKTMTPNEYKGPKPVKRNILFNYIYCLIFIIFLYFVFKSS